jgi:hypothetical protein
MHYYEDDDATDGAAGRLIVASVRARDGGRLADSCWRLRRL